MAETNEKQAILIAEDEEINRTILREMLKDDYRILEAENGNQAIFYIQAEEENIALIILDIHMPKLDGFGVMDYLVENNLTEKIPVMITTVDRSSNVLISGKKNKVADIVYKPFRASDIRKRVETLIELCRYEQSLDQIIREKSRLLTSQYNTLRKAKAFIKPKWDESVRKLMTELLPDHAKHAKRIKAYTYALSTALAKNCPRYGLTENSCKIIADDSTIHDLGIVIIPDEVFAPHNATAHRGLMQIRKRPVAAAELINIMFTNPSNQPERKYAYEICKYMHEQYDGKGYPEGLQGNEIPISAQIVALCHRYDELRFPSEGTEEPHKHVMKVITEADFRSYNPDILDTFEAISDTIEELSKAD